MKSYSFCISLNLSCTRKSEIKERQENELKGDLHSTRSQDYNVGEENEVWRLHCQKIIKRYVSLPYERIFFFVFCFFKKSDNLLIR